MSANMARLLFDRRRDVGTVDYVTHHVRLAKDACKRSEVTGYWAFHIAGAIGGAVAGFFIGQGIVSRATIRFEYDIAKIRPARRTE
jgi:hypothetical protein